MRVVQLSTHLERCGIATYTEALAGGLADVGVDVRFLSPKLQNGGPQTPGVSRLWSRDEATSVEAIRTFAALLALRPDAVHAQITPALFSAPFLRTLVRLCRAANLPFFATLHSRLEPSPRQRERLLALVGALRRADIIVHNEAHAAELERDRVHVVPHGIGAIRAAPRDEARAAFGFAADEPVVAHFGFLLPDKGIDQVLEAMAALRRELPRLRYLVVGGLYDVVESREYFARLQTLARSLGIHDRSTMNGAFLSDDEARRALAAADWVLLNYLTGNSQGTSGAARFALTAGRPVAVSTAPVFDDMRSAVHTVYRPLERSIAELFTDRGLADETLRRSAAYAEDNSWRRIAERHVALYEAARGALRRGAVLSSERS